MLAPETQVDIMPALHACPVSRDERLEMFDRTYLKSASSVHNWRT